MDENKISISLSRQSLEGILEALDYLGDSCYGIPTAAVDAIREILQQSPEAVKIYKSGEYCSLWLEEYADKDDEEQ